MSIDKTTLRIGDVFIGPREGRRELIAWDGAYGREIEAWVRHQNAVAPASARSVAVAFGGQQRYRWLSLRKFLVWLENAERITEGTGMPWPYLDCPICHGIGMHVALGASQRPGEESIKPCPDCRGASWERGG